VWVQTRISAFNALYSEMDPDVSAPADRSYSRIPSQKIVDPVTCNVDEGVMDRYAYKQLDIVLAYTH